MHVGADMLLESPVELTDEQSVLVSSHVQKQQVTK